MRLIVGTEGENEEVEPAADEADGPKPLLVRYVPILKHHGMLKVELLGKRKVNPVFSEVGLALRAVPRRHEFS